MAKQAGDSKYAKVRAAVVSQYYKDDSENACRAKGVKTENDKRPRREV